MTYAVCNAHVAFRAEIVARNEQQSESFCIVRKDVCVVFERLDEKVKRAVGAYASVADFRPRVIKQVAIRAVKIEVGQSVHALFDHSLIRARGANVTECAT